MAVNLINNEQIHVNQDGSNITLDIQNEALKNKNVVVGTIRSKNLLRDSLIETSSSGLTLKNKKDGSTTITGTQSSSTVYFVNTKYIPVSDIETGNYTISFNNASYGNISYRLRKWNGSTKTIIQNETLLQTENYSLALNLKNLIDNDTIQVELDIVCFGTNAKNVTLYPMIEKGSTATNFSQYQNLNGYDNYTSGEQIIGAWIDGKPLYRKVVDTGQISSTTKTVAHNVINMDICTDIRGIAYFNNNTFYILPRVETASLNHQCTLYCNRTNIYLQAGSDCNFDGSFVIVEYTKTTD